METIVIGCGVIGLSTGIRLLEAGDRVRIVAKSVPPNTTSNKAAAVWYPYKAYPEEKVLGWSAATFDTFQELLNVPEAGVFNKTLLEPFEERVPDPWWKSAVSEFRRATAEELPDGFVDGYIVTVPLIDTHIYMDYLIGRFKNLGGEIEALALEDIRELDGRTKLVINCAGLGSRELVADREVYPIRGQIIRVKAPQVSRAVVDEFSSLSLTYIIPRSEDVILGGTAQENNWDVGVDDETAAEILRKTRRIEPALADAEILEHTVGLRPGRKHVRLEVEQFTADLTVIHNYGHGGAGFTLSWGCADEVVRLVRALSEK